MKTIRLTGTMILCLLLLAGTSVYGQESKDLKLKQEAEMKARKEMLEKQRMEQKEQEALMRKYEIQFSEQADEIEEGVRAATREASRARVYVRSSGDEPSAYFFSTDDSRSQSQLTLRNSFSGGSDSSKGEFDVESDTRQFRCMISGKVRSGEIIIKLMYPGGKVFKELTINSSAEVTYSQTLSIKEDAQEKYVGSWTYEVKAEKAEGNYTLSISTN